MTVPEATRGSLRWLIVVTLILGTIGVFAVRCSMESRSLEKAGGEPSRASRDVHGRRVGVDEARVSIPARVPSIEGVVRDSESEGEGLADALVCASPKEATTRLGHGRVLPTSAGLLGTVCARSGANGRFRLQTRTGSFTLRAEAPGRRPGPQGTLVVEVASGLALSSVELVLERGGLLVLGHIVDRFGGPVEGALLASDHGSFGVSKDDGSFTLTVDDSRSLVVAWCPGYVTQGMPVLAPKQDLTITLIPESVVEGMVTDSDENPLVGIEVRTGRHDESEITTTDDRGIFRLSGLRPGLMQFRATDDEHDGTSSPMQVGVGVHLQGVVIRATSSEWPIWRIIDASTREPCLGGSVLLRSEAAPSLPVFRAHATGSLRLVDVQAGPYQAVVQCPGYVTLSDELLVATRDLRVIEMVPGVTLTGTVRDALDEPAANARVYVRGDPSTISRSDSRGLFSIHGVERGPVTLVANAANSLGTTPATLSLDLSGDFSDARDDIELSLPATGDLRGRLLTEDDLPAVGAHVVLQKTEGFAVLRLVSDDSGVFAGAPAPGSYIIAASWGEPPQEFDELRQTVEILESEATIVTLHLPTRPNYRTSGRVLDQDGEPIPDVAVRASSGSEVLTDADGRFSIGNLQDPEVTLTLSSDDGAHARYRDLNIRESKDLELMLATTVEVCGNVEGLVPGEVFVVEGFRFAAEDGSFCVPGVPRGRQSIVAEQDNRSGSVSVEVDDLPSTLKIVLAAPAGPVRGRVLNGEGNPILGHVWLMGPDGGYVRSTTTDTAGAFSFSIVPSGAISLIFRRPGQTRGRAQWPRADLQVAAGTTYEGVEIVANSHAGDQP